MPSVDVARARPSRVLYAAAAALDFVYPNDCISCGTRVASDDPACLCRACMSRLPRIASDQCSRCGSQLGPHANAGRACASCAGRSGLFFKGAAAVCRYEGAARDLVHGLKYERDLRAAGVMGGEMWAKLRDADWFDRVTALVPVPLHWTRRIARRFNQSELLARKISRECGKPVLAGALKRVRRTEPQTRLRAAERVENVRGVFKATRRKRTARQVLLLVDDVMTTCATAAECSRALVKGGARGVYVAVFAR